MNERDPIPLSFFCVLVFSLMIFFFLFIFV
jgi:hypothetical protein